MTGKTTDPSVYAFSMAAVSVEKVRHFSHYHYGIGKLTVCKFLTLSREALGPIGPSIFKGQQLKV
jgi:hypothetical protein